MRLAGGELDVTRSTQFSFSQRKAPARNYLLQEGSVSCLSEVRCGAVLPGEAVFTVRSPLIHGQHVGVGRTREHQLPHREVSQRPQAPAFIRAQKPLRPFYAFVLHGIFCNDSPVPYTDHHL